MDFVHVYKPPAEPGGPVLLTLHGTGGNEHDLVPLAEMLLPGAGVLSPRGQVLERGMPRFFRRLAEGVFDIDDLKRRSQEPLGGAVLFRAMVPLIPDALPKLPTTPVLLSNGRSDPLVSAEETERLAALLRSAGADVTVSWQHAGHELTDRDVMTAREWLGQHLSR
jgi:predicted esterase